AHRARARRPGGGGGGPGPPGGLGRVEGPAAGGGARRAREPVELAAVDDLVRHQDVAGPGVDHGLRLADRGAGQAGGARSQLAERERGGAVRLHVRADLLRRAAAPSLGGGDVRLECAHIDDEHGRREGRWVHRWVSTRPAGRGPAMGYAARNMPRPQPQPDPAQPGPAPARRGWGAVSIVLVGAFMALLDVTIVNVALPSIRTGLHASPASL